MVKRRHITRSNSVGIRLITRRGNDWSERFPLVVEAVNHLKVRSCLIDGEVVCCARSRPVRRPAPAPQRGVRLALCLRPIGA